MSDQILKIVKKHQFMMENHGIVYQTWYEGSQNTLKHHPVNYWTLDVEKKVAFLYTFLKQIHQWMHFQKIGVNEELRQEYYKKAQLFDNYLQSYRINIETVMDDKEHQQHIDMYIYFVNQIEDCTTRIMEMTKPPSFWDWFSI